jgi:UDP-2,3-diacylglucosamine pyrophosphatase LpxH
MENDFSTLLEQIIEFQKSKSVKTHVYFLGDLTEMWGTRDCIECFLYKDFDGEIKKLNVLIKELYKIVGGPAKSLLKKLIDLRIEKLPTDPTIIKQTSSLLNDKKNLDKIYIFDNESGDNLSQKAKYLEGEILKKYKNGHGDDFKQLFENIKFKYRINGNHDNFLQIDSLAAHPFIFNPSLFSINRREKQTDYLIMHGHNLDEYNNDSNWSIGYSVVSILNLLDAKQGNDGKPAMAGDLLRDFESNFLGDPHKIYMPMIALILSKWEERKTNASMKNMIIIHAHTHLPYLEDISDQYEKLKDDIRLGKLSAQPTYDEWLQARERYEKWIKESRKIQERK